MLLRDSETSASGIDSATVTSYCLLFDLMFPLPCQPPINIMTTITTTTTAPPPILTTQSPLALQLLLIQLLLSSSYSLPQSCNCY